MLGGRGDECCEKIKNLRSVPGLLASIVGLNFSAFQQKNKSGPLCSALSNSILWPYILSNNFSVLFSVD